MKNKLPEKYNDSCVKMFQFLQLLTEDEADYEKVIELFSSTKEAKNNTNVTLNKYLNTLKIFGIKVKKFNKKFHILNSPYTIDLSSEELETMKLLSAFIDAYPDEKNKKIFLEFLKQIDIRLTESCRSHIKCQTEANTKFKLYFSEYKNLIEECERYCTDKFKLKLTYINEENKEETINAIPQEVKYYKRKICFSVYNTGTAEICDIPLNDITNIKELPTKSAETCLSMTVVYKVKSRLAKSYKLKEGESTQGYDENGHLIIINKNEDHNQLLKRLMRYGCECEVISPKSFKNKMKQLIESTLTNYQKNT